MKLSGTRILGVIGIIGAPWMFIDFVNNGLYEHFMLTPISGMRNFIFMAGWICSVIGLYKLGAEGNKRWARIILIVQLVLLSLAALWSIIGDDSTQFAVRNFLRAKFFVAARRMFYGADWCCDLAGEKA
jgi:hypothetical protein